MSAPRPVEQILSRLPRPFALRRLVGIAGPPASGKSTLAKALADALIAGGETAVIVPMDGFHLDNAILSVRGLLARKGAPETFDSAGFAALLPRLRSREDVAVPLFDRTRDLAIAGAAVVAPACDYVIVEGNYLLLNEDPWRSLSPLWDMTVYISPPAPVLRERLIARWTDHGLALADALARAEGNDMVNARRIEAWRLPSDLTFA